MARVRRCRGGVVLWGWLVSSLFCVVRADPGAPDRADELFEAGKAHLSAKDYKEACRLLDESYRLDPATGSLLALALCHEREGKLASALREYQAAVNRARAEGHAERERAALEKVATITGSVSKLTLVSAQPSGTRDFGLRVNGEPVDTAQLGRPLPVDGGMVQIEAEARDKRTWCSYVTLAPAGDTRTVAIPTLEVALPFVAPAPPPPPIPGSPPGNRADGAPRPPRVQRAGLGLLGAGTVSLVIGVGYTGRAIRKDNASDAGCVDDFCTPDARDERLAARTAGNAATVALAAGATLASVGVALFLRGRRRAERRARIQEHPVSMWAAPDAAGVRWRGRF